MAKSIEDLCRFLDNLEDRVDLPDLLIELNGLQVDWDAIADYVCFSERGYARNLVRAGEWYHLLVLCWKNGQRSPIHDHAGSSCGVRVLRGTMTETRCEFAANGHVKAVGSCDYAAGSVVGSQDFDLHQISNLQAGEADLVTLHVYSPPLLRMGTYSMLDQSRGEELMLMEFCDAAGI
jgi:cysteine dioxygenase